MKLILKDINSSGLSIGYNLTSDTLIAAGVEVTADPAVAVAFSSTASLFNYGSIISSGHAGILSTAGTATIFNGTGATITGDPAIHTQLGNTDVTNFGSIVGTGDAAILTIPSAGLLHVENHGTIYGPHVGIDHFSNSSALIENTGIIEGGMTGVHLDTFDGVFSIVDNSGTIGGFGASIEVDAGRLYLTNGGTLKGDVDLHAAPNNQADTIINTGKIVGSVYLGGGADSFTGGGATTGIIYGGKGADVIGGGSGDNVIDGGAGKDTLAGGEGADRFVFSTALNAANNVDHILDLSVPQDTIDLDNAVFAALGATGNLAARMFHKGAHAHDANDHIIYNAATGALLYDSNGNAAGGEVKFATLAHHLALTAADFLVV